MKKILSFILSALLLQSSFSFAQEAPVISPILASAHSIDRPLKNALPAAQGVKGMVVSQDTLASQVGVEILKKGGNAVDAAVAIGFALAVTLPYAGNIGGGGFMLVHDAGQNKTMAIDYREVAPLKSEENMFLDDLGDVDIAESRYSYASVAVPGTVKGLELALQLYGTMALKDVMAPAIRLADEGFVVSDALAYYFKEKEKFLKRSAANRKVFFHSNDAGFRLAGKILQAGDLLVQKDLAWSLSQIAEYGSDAFYKGIVGQKMVDAIRAGGGVMTMRDLDIYEARLREPIEGMYRGYKIVSMPPPSSGGVHLIEMLNVLEQYPIAEYGFNTAKTVHVMVEAMRRAYADRSRYLGDPDFVHVPVDELTSRLYAKRLKDSISENAATPSELIYPGAYMKPEGNNTTHFSVMDRFGNVVSNTYTLNFTFGTGLMAEGTGILLNNEMDDFSAKAGVPNAYGLTGAEANKIEAEKRPLSSMTPTIVFYKGLPFMATGSPGGSHIITTVLQIIMNVVDHKMDISRATVASRVHHQWLPDILRVEKGVEHTTLDDLLKKGHDIEAGPDMGGAMSILYSKGIFYGAADPRKAGSLAIGF